MSQIRITSILDKNDRPIRITKMQRNYKRSFTICTYELGIRLFEFGSTKSSHKVRISTLSILSPCIINFMYLLIYKIRRRVLLIGFMGFPNKLPII